MSVLLKHNIHTYQVLIYAIRIGVMINMQGIRKVFSLSFPESTQPCLPKIVRILPLDAPLTLAKQDIW